MEEADVTFELHLNPCQYASAADVLETVPKLRVIIDHRGTPNDIDQLKSDEYWNGIKRFATLPNVFMKISFFARTDPKWENGDFVLEKSLDLIKLFTPQRCMFASNFPVDVTEQCGSWTSKGLFEAFATLAKEFTAEERACLYSTTALKVYRMDLAAGDGKKKQ